MREEERVLQSHHLIDIKEFEKTLDIDYPNLRKELGFDPRRYRPVAIRLAGGLLMDGNTYSVFSRYPDNCKRVIEATEENIRGNRHLTEMLDLDSDNLHLFCIYIGVLLVNICDYLERRVVNSVGNYKYLKITTTPSEYVQTGNDDTVALSMVIEILDNPNLVGHEHATPAPDSAVESVPHPASAGEVAAPWAADAKW